MQLRLTKENEGLLAKIGLTSGTDINKWINDSLKQNGSILYTPQQPIDFSSLLPFLSSIEESLAIMACASGRVWQRTLNESSERESKPLVISDFDLSGVPDRFNLVGQSIRLPKTSVQWIWMPDEKAPSSLNYWTPSLTLEEQYWWPKKPKKIPLSDDKQQWVDDLFNKTINGISSDGDWESSSGATRNIWLVYQSLKWPANLYDQYVRLMQEWLLDNWEEKAELFRF